MSPGAHLTVAELRYLKASWYVWQGEASASVGSVAERVGVSHASASQTVKRLVEYGLLRREAGQREITLTPQGEAEALRLVRRHRLLETFLHEMLGFTWDEVHDEAEQLEWSVSDRLVERIAHRLGDPERDPHGDPIPRLEGPHEEEVDLPLANLGAGTSGVIVRVADDEPALLRHLAEEGLGLGVSITVERQDPFDGPLWISSSQGRHALGAAAVRAISVSTSSDVRASAPPPAP